MSLHQLSRVGMLAPWRPTALSWHAYAVGSQTAGFAAGSRHPTCVAARYSRFLALRHWHAFPTCAAIALLRMLHWSSSGSFLTRSHLEILCLSCQMEPGFVISLLKLVRIGYPSQPSSLYVICLSYRLFFSEDGRELTLLFNMTSTTAPMFSRISSWRYCATACASLA